MAYTSQLTNTGFPNMVPAQPNFSLGDQLGMIGMQSAFQGLGSGLNFGIRNAMEPTPQQILQQQILDAQASRGPSLSDRQVTGGVSGALSGGTTGAAIGTSIAPGIGTAIGAGAGSLVAGLGGALLPMFFEPEQQKQYPTNYVQQRMTSFPSPMSNQQSIPLESLVEFYGVSNPYGYV